MGIDMYPTDESLEECEDASCSGDLKKIVALFPPEELEQELAGLVSPEDDEKKICLERLTTDQKSCLVKYDTSDWDYEHAWEVRSFDERKAICARCPVRPPGYTNCFIRLCGYSAMNDFRTGLAAIVECSKGLTADECRQWIAPNYLGDKSPSEKLQELFASH